LTFTAFWSHLASLYDKDSQGQLRLAWEAVKLPPGELTLEKWHTFLREFHLKRDRVEERTPHEEYTLLMKSLPIDWQRKVLTEEAKNAKGKWLVRLTGLPSMPLRHIQHLLEETIGTTLHQVESISGGLIVHCDSPTIQTQLVGLNNWSLEGQVIRASRMDKALTGDAVADFITERLQTEQKLLNMRNNWEEPPRFKVHQVEPQAYGREKPTPKDSPKDKYPKGKGDKKPAQQQSSSSSQKPTCGYCAGEGRNPNHDGVKCKFWAEFIELSKKYCKQCHNKGRPSQHSWQECPNYKPARGKGGKGAKPEPAKDQQPSPPADKAPQEKPIVTASSSTTGPQGSR
jgi:hypothetical protein